MPGTIKETLAAQRKLGELIDMYSDRSDQMIREFISGRAKAKELIRGNNFIGNNESESIDQVRYDYQWVVFYVGAESIRLCYLVEPDRLVVFWYWRSNDPLNDPRLRDAIAIHRR